jgi:hypothetical protein
MFIHISVNIILHASNVCQIITVVTLDTLDNMVYTLDILAANYEQTTYGGNHGKSGDGENES